MHKLNYDLLTTTMHHLDLATILTRTLPIMVTISLYCAARSMSFAIRNNLHAYFCKSSGTNIRISLHCVTRIKHQVFCSLSAQQSTSSQ